MPVLPDDYKRSAQPDALAARQADDRASYGQIFRTTSLIEGASVINLLFGVVRTKVIAILLGPAGIGLLGILNALMTAAVTISQMGLGTVGTRQIAEAHATGDMTRILAPSPLSITAGAVVGSANAFYFAIELNRKLGLARIVNRFRRGGRAQN